MHLRTSRGTHDRVIGMMPCIICEPSSFVGMRTLRTKLAYTVVGDMLDSAVVGHAVHDVGHSMHTHFL
jgi:hypothetical protein